jgi:hypothetical protein
LTGKRSGLHSWHDQRKHDRKCTHDRKVAVAGRYFGHEDELNDKLFRIYGCDLGAWDATSMPSVRSDVLSDVSELSKPRPIGQAVREAFSEYYDNEGFDRDGDIGKAKSDGGRMVDSDSERGREWEREREEEGGGVRTVSADELSTPGTVYTAKGNWGESNGWDPSCSLELELAHAMSSSEASARVGDLDEDDAYERAELLLCSVKNNPCAHQMRTYIPIQICMHAYRHAQTHIHTYNRIPSYPAYILCAGVCGCFVLCVRGCVCELECMPCGRSGVHCVCSCAATRSSRRCAASPLRYPTARPRRWSGSAMTSMYWPRR